MLHKCHMLFTKLRYIDRKYNKGEVSYGDV